MPSGASLEPDANVYHLSPAVNTGDVAAAYCSDLGMQLARVEDQLKVYLTGQYTRMKK